ncbi:type II toxin-antitoxin system RelE family toxin [Eubacterium maltosivorans]|uniref:type II toxin-antitoxin system RelE family toxin n=1 Tax=Eubacterium maltosivorans TaxID=2041044 RepID=UPI00189EF37E|nr:type II toxin-antitoxin system RelE/ParE family toxin [Eubacterium maltosivorans]
MYRVVYTKHAIKALEKMDKHTATLVYSWIEKNLEGCANPYQYGKGLSANRSGQWRYRIGDYRLVCEISEQTITIVVLNVGHRKEIYKH